MKKKSYLQQHGNKKKFTTIFLDKKASMKAFTAFADKINQRYYMVSSKTGRLVHIPHSPILKEGHARLMEAVLAVIINRIKTQNNRNILGSYVQPFIIRQGEPLNWRIKLHDIRNYAEGKLKNKTGIKTYENRLNRLAGHGFLRYVKVYDKTIGKWEKMLQINPNILCIHTENGGEIIKNSGFSIISKSGIYETELEKFFVFTNINLNINKEKHLTDVEKNMDVGQDLQNSIKKEEQSENRRTTSANRKRELRNLIISKCKIQHSTFYAWINRKKIPLLSQEKIAEIIGVSIEELFPTEKIEKHFQFKIKNHEIIKKNQQLFS